MANGTPSGFRVTPQAVLGLMIVAVGILLTADNLGWADTDEVIIRYWPVVLVVVGLAKVLQTGARSGRMFGLILMLFGGGLLAERVLLLPINVGDWWPILLVALGIAVIFRARGSAPVPGLAGDSDSTVSEIAIWAGKQRRSASSSFRHGDLTAVMGGVEFDLRQAGTATGEAIIDVFVLWGGVEIWVPPDWAVSNRVALLMGGAEDKSTGRQDARHRLIVRGFVVMGGLEIKT